MNNNMYRQFQREIKKAERKAEVRETKWKIAFISLMIVSLIFIFGQAAYYEHNGIFSIEAKADTTESIPERDSKMLATVVEIDVVNDIVVIAKSGIVNGNVEISGDEWDFYGVEDYAIGDVIMVTFDGSNIYTSEIKDVWYIGYVY